MRKRDNIIDSVRLSPGECEALLDALDRANASKPPSSRRQTRRWRYRDRMIVAVRQGGSVQSFFTAPRNISNSGIGFLHGGYIHVGSPVAVSTRDLHGQLRTLKGRVVRCVHVQGRLHEVGAKFTEPINPKDFVPPGDEPCFNVERVDVANLYGRVLVVDDVRADQRLLAFHFRGSQLDLTYAADAASTVAILDNSFDLVFLDTTLPDKSGLETLVELRMRGYAGPVIAVLPSDDRDMRARLLRAGANEVVSKPLDPDLLRQAAAEFLIAGGCDAETTLLYSSINDPRMRELIEMYVVDCKRAAEEIADYVEAGDFAGVRRAVEQLVGSAAAHGFSAIDRLAAEALRTLELSHSIDEAGAPVQAVINACRRAAVRLNDDGGKSAA